MQNQRILICIVGAPRLGNRQQKGLTLLLWLLGGAFTYLEESMASWLSTACSTPISHDGICVSNGASAHLTYVTLKLIDPMFTRNIFTVESTYFVDCPIFRYNGCQGKLKSVPGDEPGID